MRRMVITIDNGGSELRLINGDSGIIKMDKDISLVERDDFRIKDNIDMYDVVDIIEAPRKEYIGLYSTGIAYYMYNGQTIQMSNQSKKSTSIAWYQQELVAMAINIAKNLNEEYNEHKYEEGYNIENEVEVVLTTLIPVQEHSGKIDYATRLKSNLEGRYVVKFPVIKDGINTIKFNLSKDKICVLPEGVVAMTSLRDIVTSNDYTLILDMGHVTTDLSICKGINMIGNAVISSQFAGGTLLKLISNAIRNHGHAGSDEVAIEALNTNKFRVGKKEIDITSEMDITKKMFVKNYIKNEILNEIELAGITAANIQYVVPIGAVLGSKNKDGKYDILEYIIEEVGLDNAEIKLVAEDPRFVNVEKADEFAKIFSKRV